MAEGVRQRMVDTAAVLLARHGLQATSFTEVLKASGAPRGSLYHHFPGGKDDLVLAALDAAGSRAGTVLDGIAGQPADVVAERFIGLWRAVLTRSDFTAGCSLLAVTVAADSEPLLDKAGTIFAAWTVRIAGLLAEGGVPAEQSTALATSLIAACEGGVVLARAARSLAPYDAVASVQLATIRSAMTDPTDAPPETRSF